MKQRLSITLLALTLCGLSGCSTSSTVALLDAVAISAEAALPILEASGTLTPADEAAITAYLDLATTNIGQAVAIVQANPNNLPTVASQVIALIDGITTAPALSGAITPKDAALIVGVSRAAQAFLAVFRQQTAAFSLTRPDLVMGFAGGAPVRLTHTDHSRLKSIRKRMERAKAKLRGGK